MAIEGGSIMVWGCFSAKDTGNVSIIDGKMNAAVYQNILEANLMISVENLELSPDWNFLQNLKRIGFLKIIQISLNELQKHPGSENHQQRRMEQITH